ncbi:hypothetical protein HNO53_12885 [Billgrantia antri]|uniref:Bacteriophage phiJL001 Gp84 C-terminal domain-containing protein n=1 Tax=Halomonas sulfidivorans TaxID=2733488 RepID=A0ABX7WHL4_9GAMM|nr:phage BR0599 family protein [Halomonas sulfidivorans]QTP59531.1 hypothetical protein HNO53_12885 [Halomonas sulfidivorans]
MAVVEVIEFTYRDQSFKYTSSRKIQSIAGKIFSPIAANRSVVVKSESDSRDLEIEVSADNEVVQLFKNATPDATVTVKVSRVVGDELHPYFTGNVAGVSFSAQIGATARASITCSSIISKLSTSGLNYTFSAGCNHLLYSNECGLKFSDWADTVTVEAMSNRGFTIQAESLKGKPDKHYVSGLCEFNGIYAMISGYDPTAGTITLFAPITGIAVGSIIKAAKGCNRSLNACVSFNNEDNFYGFPWIPSDDIWTSGVMRPVNPFKNLQ